MHYVVKLEMEDHGRMLPRVLQALEHAQAALEHLTFDRRGERLHCRLIVEIDVQRCDRMTSLLWKIHGLSRLSAQSSL